MVGAKKATEIADRRRQVAQLYLRKVGQEKIAEQLGVNRATISRDLTWLRKEWARQAVGNMAERKGRELAELEAMELDCAMQYAASKDVRWPTLRLRVKERIAKMLGLDAPVKGEFLSRGIDLTRLTDEQLRRIADGEDPLLVLARAGAGSAGTEATGQEPGR